MKIAAVAARDIFDSRGIPTIECTLTLDDGHCVTASVPSGISRSSHEAFELRDGDEWLMGMGVEKALINIETIIAHNLTGRVPHVGAIDELLLTLDGTDNKSNLGANAMLAVSLAVCRAQAYMEKVGLFDLIALLCNFSTISIPLPMFNMIGGGLHANNKTIIQEFLVVPTKALSFHDAMEIGAIIFYTARQLLHKKGKSTAVGYEGEFIADFNSETEVLDFIMETIESAGCTGDVMISLDVAASSFYNATTKNYVVHNKHLSAQDLIDWYQQLIDLYPLYSIEDGLAEDDWDNWIVMRHMLGSRIQIIGDDIFATNPERIWQGIELHAATASLIKPNQIGTVTETVQAIMLCQEHKWPVIISHRSGETNDSFIADLAVGAGATHIKSGGFCRGERMAKYNRLLAIERDIYVRDEK